MTDTQIRGPAWIPVFLETLADTKAVGLAIAATGKADNTVYSQQKKNKAFADAWVEALRVTEGEAEQAMPISTGGWKKRFLEALAETSNVKASAERTNTPLSTVYGARRKDRDFARKWEEALFEGYSNLEMEVLGYLRDPDPGYKMDVANALRLLAVHRETVAREKARRGKRDKASVLASLNARIDKMRERKAAAEKLLAEDGVRRIPGNGSAANDRI